MQKNINKDVYEYLKINNEEYSNFFKVLRKIESQQNEVANYLLNNKNTFVIQRFRNIGMSTSISKYFSKIDKNEKNKRIVFITPKLNSSISVFNLIKTNMLENGVHFKKNNSNFIETSNNNHFFISSIKAFDNKIDNDINRKTKVVIENANFIKNDDINTIINKARINSYDIKGTLCLSDNSILNSNIINVLNNYKINLITYPCIYDENGELKKIHFSLNE